MSRFPLWQRLCAVFALLLLGCCGASVAMLMHLNARHGQEVIQSLSSGLAAHIAENATLMEPQGLNQPAVRSLFGKLMDVNPSVEVYLLDAAGRIVGDDAPAGHLRRDAVDLAPVRRLLAGATLPIFGDDPRSDSARKVFSVAPLRVAGHDAGYVYVVLLGEQHDALAMQLANDSLLRTALAAMGLVATLGLLVGLAAFYGITRPLRQLTAEVQGFDAGGGVTPAGADGALVATPAEIPRDEIATLRAAYAQMTRRIAEQWQSLALQDQQRRELVANISHDLRTPLTSLHGYLETLRLKADTLSEDDRRRYLDVALGQSRKVGRLAQELFELARLECGVVKPDAERFSIADLVQDVFQKFELAAEARQQRLVPVVAADLPTVTADLGLIERVLTNLLDNAIRHTPVGGEIQVELRRDGPGGVDVTVRDSGPGIPAALRPHLFTRPSFGAGAHPGSGGLGLMIVQRILQLHGSAIRLLPDAEHGAAFGFRLAAP